MGSTIATRSSAPNECAERLFDAVKAVLQDAIKAGGSSLRDHRRTDGELGYFQHHFRVYDREGARCVTPGCKDTVKRIVQTGRSTFFCRLARSDAGPIARSRLSEANLGSSRAHICCL
jgi:formamidopyrimidine-DNA glycosylase